MKSLLRRLPRSKSKSRRSENTTSGGGGTENQNNKLDDLRVPKIETADLKVGPHQCAQLLFERIFRPKAPSTFGRWLWVPLAVSHGERVRTL